VLQFVGFQPTEGKGETGEGGGRGEGEDGEATTSVALFRLLPWPGRNFGPGAPTSTNTQTGDWWELLRIDVVLDVRDAVLAVAGLHAGCAYGLYLRKELIRITLRQKVSFLGHKKLHWACSSADRSQSVLCCLLYQVHPLFSCHGLVGGTQRSR
jgi:hypothetical protein